MPDYHFYLVSRDRLASFPPATQAFETDDDAHLYGMGRATLKLSVDVWSEGNLVCKIPRRVVSAATLLS